MARPSATPRLSTLDASAVADEVIDRVTNHVTTLLLALDHSCTWSIPESAVCLLRHEASWLATYAQRGLPVGDWTDHGCAADALVSVCASLYSQAGRPGAIGGPEDVDVDPTEPVDIVLLAAQARIRIDRRGRVPVRELACLASVDPDHVRLLGRKGEIEVEDGEIRAAECRRWLSARGVEGL